MVTVPSRLKLTHEDYLQIPNDGKKHELIDGEHFMTPSPVAKHQMAVGNLFLLLETFVRKQNLGRVFVAPFDVILSDYDVVEPDLIFISRERMQAIVKEWIRGAPDLIVEVLSPSTAEIDCGLKMKLYEKYRVSEYWLADPATEIIEVYVLRQDGYELFSRASKGQRVKSVMLKNFEIPSEEVFA